MYLVPNLRPFQRVTMVVETPYVRDLKEVMKNPLKPEVAGEGELVKRIVEGPYTRIYGDGDAKIEAMEPAVVDAILKQKM